MSNASLLSSQSCSSARPGYDELVSIITRQQQEIELYKLQLEKLKGYIYGRRSEKQYTEFPVPGNLFDEPSVPQPKEEFIEVASHKKRRNSKKSVPQELPVEESVYQPEETQCQCCAKELKEVSRDIREELDFEPARFFKRRYITVNKSCPVCKTMHSGEVPVNSSPVIPGSQIGAGLLAHVVTSKICDHQPYYRQSKIYEREGVTIPDKALSRYGLAVGSLLEPVAKAIKDTLLSKTYLQADETRLQVLDPTKQGTTHRGQLWLLSDPLGGLVYYEYHDNRAKRAAHALLGSYSGALQTDAYTCYNEHQGVQLGCMAHARRYFIEAKQLASKECKHVIALIGELYKIESNLKTLRAEMPPDDWHEKRLTTRQKLAIPILESLKMYLVNMRSTWLLERHPMYKAINYMLNRYDSFCVYTLDGRFEIDNNAAENMMRPVALGRRNWMFAGSEHGAEMTAVMMSVVRTCLRLKINPQRYLADVLPRLASHKTRSLDGLLPWDWTPAPK